MHYRRRAVLLFHSYSDAHAAPLLCAGLIGYRSFVKAGDAQRIGIYGFGTAAHIICQIARQHGRQIFALTRLRDSIASNFVLSLGAVWAGDSTTRPPGATQCRDNFRVKWGINAAGAQGSRSRWYVVSGAFT
jgi:propanol-preferring alcohol dehydrogenase